MVAGERILRGNQPERCDRLVDDETQVGEKQERTEQPHRDLMDTRTQVQDSHPGDDEPDAREPGDTQRLAPQKPTREDRPHGPQSGPDGIGEAQGQVA